MTKEQLIEKLSAIPGNPRIVLQVHEECMFADHSWCMAEEIIVSPEAQQLYRRDDRIFLGEDVEDLKDELMSDMDQGTMTDLQMEAKAEALIENMKEGEPAVIIEVSP